MRASLSKTLKLHLRYYPVSKTLSVTLSNEAIPLSKTHKAHYLIICLVNVVQCKQDLSCSLTF